MIQLFKYDEVQRDDVTEMLLSVSAQRKISN
jgi:hypothetical protein